MRNAFSSNPKFFNDMTTTKEMQIGKLTFCTGAKAEAEAKRVARTMQDFMVMELLEFKTGCGNFAARRWSSPVLGPTR